MKKHHLHLWLILILFAISGLMAGFGTRIVQAALSRRVVQQAPVPVPAITASATTPANILASDTFQRPDQTLWGIASDGQQWDGDANRLPLFSIVNGTGLIAGSRGVVQTVLGPVTADAQVSASGFVNHFGDGVNFGVVLRWNDPDNWYKAYIDGSRLIILKRVGGVSRQIGQMAFTAQDNASYTLRFRAVGATLFASVWPSAALEPEGWLISLSDTSLFSGRGGVRMVLSANSVVSVTSFLETAVG